MFAVLETVIVYLNSVGHNDGTRLKSKCKIHIFSDIYVQKDALLHYLFVSLNCSTCFGWYLHPSSGAHTTVSTACDTCQTVTDRNKLRIKCMGIKHGLVKVELNVRPARL